MRLTRDGVTVEVSDKAHIDAYLSSGWKPIGNATEAVAPKPQRTTVTKTQI